MNPTLFPPNARSCATACLILAVLTLSLFQLSPGAAAQASAQSGQQRHSSLDERNPQGLTPLIAAAVAGQTDTVRALLGRGASVNATAADGRTALIAAVEGDHIDLVRLLIAAGANLNEATRATGTALEVAENKDETGIAALLLASGAHSSGKSVGDTVCVRPWGGDGYCGTVKAFTVRSVELEVTRVVGCANGCSAKAECSEFKPVGGADGLQSGRRIAVPSWCLTQTGVKP